MAREKDENNLYKTPMYDVYLERGAKITDFGGWGLPIQITTIKDEHEAVRNGVGLFDASHMGEVVITGEKLMDWWNGLITNDCRQCEPNQAQYTAVVKEDGGTLDDLIYYKFSDEKIFVTPNASNREKIVKWLNDHNKEGVVEIDDQSFDYGLIAIQGPKAQEVLAKVTDAPLDDIKYYHFLPDQKVADASDVIVSRTGYTGEDGFELYIPWGQTKAVWEALLEAGKDEDIHECALGARDTLRLEAGLALYGNDLSEDINPIVGGIAFAVKTDKDVDFIGKESLTKVKEDKERPMSRGFELIGKGVARHGYPVYADEESTEQIGTVTSGTRGPTVGKAIGYVIIDRPYHKFDTEVFIDIRNKRVPAVICKKDWLSR